jgi:pimeloyl-ACP methyl ester carboxylesterase
MRLPEGRDVEVATPSGRLAAVDWGGSGDPLVFVHGGGSNAAEWATTVPHLVDAFHCISFDSAGHGRSPEPPSLDFDTFLVEIDAVVDHFGLDPGTLAVVGSSFGGALAVWWASVRAGCRAVVGVDSAPQKMHLEPWPPPGRVQRTPDQWRASGWGWSGTRDEYEQRVAEAVADGGLEAQARRAHTRTPEGLYEAHPSAELLAVIDRLGSRPVNPIVRVENYAHLRCPTLLLCASDGVCADNREFVDAMPERFPAVEVDWLDGPHTLNYAHPAQVAARIRRFLDGLKGNPV